MGQLTTVGVGALTVSVVIGMLAASRLPAQSSPVAQWQVAAGTKAEFEVASVKQNVSDQLAHSNVGLTNLDEAPPNGGLLSAVKFPLWSYISFAYKLTPGQAQLMASQSPKWISTNRFDIQARAAANTTRDQMRVMMQYLLADRFKLAVHFETRQLPVFGLVLDKPGKTGPRLTRLSGDAPCTSASPQVPGAASTRPEKDDGWFTPCGGIGTRFVSGRLHVGSRNLTMEQLASSLAVVSMGTLDRPILDKTGLSGKFDFRIEFAPDPTAKLPPDSQPDPNGPTFLQALKEQAGLRLEPQTGAVNVLVIDHVEQPSEN